MGEQKNNSKALAKRAAIICVYSVINPLADFLTLGYKDNLENEVQKNNMYKNENGEKMYDYVASFIEDFAGCNKQTQKDVFRLLRKYYEIETERYIETITKISGRDLSFGFSLKQYKDKEENICVEVKDRTGINRNIILFPL